MAVSCIELPLGAGESGRWWGWLLGRRAQGLLDALLDLLGSRLDACLLESGLEVAEAFHLVALRLHFHVPLPNPGSHMTGRLLHSQRRELVLECLEIDLRHCHVDIGARGCLGVRCLLLALELPRGVAEYSRRQAPEHGRHLRIFQR
eukprot:10422447-Alexandrium_andersonii.AAC.1